MSKQTVDSKQPNLPETAAAPVAPVVAPKAKKHLAQAIADLVAEAPPEELEDAARFGLSLPSGDMSAALQGVYKWGLRCADCNNVALYFIGDKFIARDGQSYDQPQSWMTVGDLPWTQRLPADEIDRLSPRCQCCGKMVPRDGDVGQFFRLTRGERSLVVDVKTWEDARDTSYNAKSARAALKARFGEEIVRAASAALEESLGGKQLSPDDYAQKLTFASEVIARTQGREALADVEYLGKEAGLIPGRAK